MVTNQAYLFLIFVINGIIIGLVFDFFRILRISFKTKDFVTYIEDIIFWIITGIILLYSIFIFNNGQIRLFMFIGVGIGIISYILLVSKYVIKINVFIVNIIKKIILIPLNFIYKIIKKIFFRPISFVIINIGKFSTNIIKKAKKNIVKKEGFFVKK